MMPMDILLNDIRKELIQMKIDADKQTVQIVAIVALTVLGSIAMIVDGDIGETIAVAVAGVLGLVGGSLFKLVREKEKV